MTTQTTQETIYALIETHTGVRVRDIKGSDDLFEDLDMDSLDLVELIMALEDKFDLEITDEDMEPVKTVDQLVTTITQLRQPCLG